MIAAPLSNAVPQITAAERQDSMLREQAKQLEAFLFAELLRVSGTGTPSPAGGKETQFDSFLRQSQAEAVAASGQTGLAEAIYRSLADQSETAPVVQEQL